VDYEGLKYTYQQSGPTGYTPVFWNQNGIIDRNNCYSYALNRPWLHLKEGVNPKKPQPGELSGKPYSEFSCKNIVNSVLNDKSVVPAKKGQCPKNYHKVQLVVDPRPEEGDYHWYRQDPNGKWSHKPGNGPATNLDASDKEILDPLKANRKYPKLNLDYKKTCQLLCAPN
jgi:hypothetical protein